MRLPYPRWGKPGPGTVGHPEDPKKWRWASRSGRRWRPPGLGGWRSGKRAAGPGTQKAAALREEGNTGHPRNFLLSTSVPFSTRNETVAPVEARLSAVIKQEGETMPGSENETVGIASQRPATKRPTLRVVGEPAGPPRRQRNSERHPREYLRPTKIETLIATAKKRGRYGHRDATMVPIAYRHGLRVGELCALTWDQVDFGQGLLHVARLKHGVPSVHPFGGEELRAMRRLRRDRSEGRHLFRTEPEAPMTPAGFRTQDTSEDRRGAPVGVLGSSTHAAPRLRLQACPTTGGTRVPSCTTSGTGTFSTPSGTPSWRLIGSRASGRAEPAGGGHSQARIAAEMQAGELG